MEKIKFSECKFHHRAVRRGYVSRKGDAVLKPYKGRFGAGYIMITPRWDTTQYVTYSYYIKED